VLFRGGGGAAAVRVNYCGYLCLCDEREWRATARDGELVDSRCWL
jgi:hypothetical protein